MTNEEALIKLLDGVQEIVWEAITKLVDEITVLRTEIEDLWAAVRSITEARRGDSPARIRHKERLRWDQYE